MDSKDLSIATQVAFKGAVDLAVAFDLDLAHPEGQAKFEEAFSYLTESLHKAITGQQSAEQQVAQVIQGQFPGSQVVSGPSTSQYSQPGYTEPSPPEFTLTVKNQQQAPLPNWLFEAAARVGETEVWDNRNEVQGSNRPPFRGVNVKDKTGKPMGFWEPKQSR